MNINRFKVIHVRSQRKSREKDILNLLSKSQILERRCSSCFCKICTYHHLIYIERWRNKLLLHKKERNVLMLHFLAKSISCSCLWLLTHNNESIQGLLWRIEWVIYQKELRADIWDYWINDCNIYIRCCLYY